MVQSGAVQSGAVQSFKVQQDAVLRRLANINSLSTVG